jgi:CIC family chloride channel protein
LPGAATAATFPLRRFLRKQAARWAAVVATLGSGCAMAFTGPAAEIGMTVGRALGLALPSEAARRRLVLACAGAGMTANFDTPLTGVFFAADISQGFIADTSTGTAASRRMDLIATFLAAAAASVACRRGFVGTGHPALNALSFTLGSRPAELAAFVALGAAGGLVNVYFDRARRAAAAAFAKVPQAARPLVGGAACTAAALLGHRQSVFDGFAAVKAIASGDAAFTAAAPLAAFLLSKGFFVVLCGAAGLFGGPFAHAQFMGAALGALAKLSFPAALASSHAAYAALGLASVVAAMFRSPLVATLLVLEFTKQVDLLVPLLVVTGTASLVSQKLV